MNHCKSIAVWFVLLSTVVCASDIEQALSSAESAYRNGEYSVAEDNYYQVLNNGFVSEDVFYNLGNAHYKQGEVAQAVWAYKSGLKIAPDNEDLLYNLQVVESELVDAITPLPQFFLSAWWQHFALLNSPTVWGVLTILFMWFLAMCIWKLLTAKPAGKQRILFGAGGFLCCALVFFAAGSTASSIASSQEIVVFAATSHIKSEPNQNSSTLFSLHEGTSAEVLTMETDWIEIKIADGNVGWIPRNQVKLVGQVHQVDD